MLDAGGPGEFDFVDGGGVAKAEVDALVAGGVVADGGGGDVELGAVAGGDLDPGAEAVAVVLDADEVEDDPVIGGGGCGSSRARVGR